MTHDELPGDDWGGDTSPRPGMREREREEKDTVNRCLFSKEELRRYLKKQLKTGAFSEQ